MSYDSYKAPDSLLDIKNVNSAKRFLVVIVCYLLSGLGILILLVEGLKDLKSFDWSWGDIFTIVCFIAWLFHFGMSIFWVFGIRLGKRIPILGTVLALLPFVSIFVINPFPFSAASIFISLFTIVFIMFFFLPTIVLAVYLISYHSKGSPRNNT